MRSLLPLLLLVLCCGCYSTQQFGLEIALPKDPGTPPVSHEQILSYVSTNEPSQEVLRSVAQASESRGLESQAPRHPYVSSVFGTSALLVLYSRQESERGWLWPHESALAWSVSVSVAYNPDRHRLLVMVGGIGNETLSPELHRHLYGEFMARFGPGSVRELWK